MTCELVPSVPEMEVSKARKMVAILVLLGLMTEQASCEVVQFIFGDSLSDVGNNNRLPRSLAQASLPWYGIDFGNGMPNGRFTNGRTVADIIGRLQSFLIHQDNLIESLI